MSHLEMLVQLVPPPAEPRETGDSTAWLEVCKRVDRPLPEDYRDLCVRYGTGWFLEREIEILNPYSERYDAALRRYSEGLLSLRESEMIPGKHPIYPKKSGLLTIGTDRDGVLICYKTVGSSSNWPIIVLSPDGTTEERWEMPLTEFLYGAFTKRFRTIFAGLDITPDMLTFTPKTPKK